MIIAAFDLSLTSTGYAVGGFGEGDFRATEPLTLAVGTLPNKLAGPERLDFIGTRVLEIATGAELVLLEGYSFGQQAGTSQSFSAGELGGVVRLYLWQAGIPYVEIAPTKLKKYATGSGKGKKEGFLVEAARRLDYAGRSHDEADALWLLHMAADAYGFGWVKLPALHRDALADVPWPAREEVARA